MSKETLFSPENDPAQESLIGTEILNILGSLANRAVNKNVLFSSAELKQFSSEQISTALAKLESQNLIRQTGDSKDPNITLIPSKSVQEQEVKPKRTTGERPSKLYRQFGSNHHPVYPYKYKK